MNISIYRKFNSDICNYSDIELKTHYQLHGCNENRIYDFKSLLQKNILLQYFDLDYYIENNPELNFPSKLDYIIDYLDNRLNDNRKISSKLTKFKNEKKQLFTSKLLPNIELNSNLNFLEKKSKFKIDCNNTIQANEWENDSIIENLIKKNSSVLNIGAGYFLGKDRYFSHKNVVNLDLLAYPTTDVVADGAKLPFQDNSFDAVISLSVLNEVDNPWKHSQEIKRVLKNNGLLYIDTSYLNVSTSENHKYSISPVGVIKLFSPDIEIIHQNIEKYNHPIFSLHSMLDLYKNSLDYESQKIFLGKTIDEILKNGVNFDLSYIKNYQESKKKYLCSGSSLLCLKK